MHIFQAPFCMCARPLFIILDYVKGHSIWVFNFIQSTKGLTTHSRMRIFCRTLQKKSSSFHHRVWQLIWGVSTDVTSLVFAKHGTQHTNVSLTSLQNKKQQQLCFSSIIVFVQRQIWLVLTDWLVLVKENWLFPHNLPKKKKATFSYFSNSTVTNF